jgi:hypothetical protein
MEHQGQFSNQVSRCKTQSMLVISHLKDLNKNKNGFNFKFFTLCVFFK